MKDVIKLDGGKYVVTHENGKITATRQGEPWRDLTGDNLFYFMMMELVDREEKPEARPIDLMTEYIRSLIGPEWISPCDHEAIAEVCLEVLDHCAATGVIVQIDSYSTRCYLVKDGTPDITRRDILAVLGK